jgi:hypothetical protein
VTAPISERPTPGTAAAGAADELQRSPRPQLAGRLAGHVQREPEVIVDRAAGLLEVHLGQRCVVGPPGGDHHVVDRPWQVLEEATQRRGVGGVEGGGAERADLLGGALEPVRVAGREDDFGPLGAGSPRRLEADAGAAPDHRDGLPEQLRLSPPGRDRGRGAHGASVRGAPTPTGWRRGAISRRSALSASR